MVRSAPTVDTDDDPSFFHHLFLLPLPFTTKAGYLTLKLYFVVRAVRGEFALRVKNVNRIIKRVTHGSGVRCKMIAKYN